MEPNPAQMLQSLADRFQEKGQDLAAAIAYGEAARDLEEMPLLWFHLAVSLRRQAGILVQRPFLEWSAKCLKRVVELAPDSELEEIAVDGLMNLSRELMVDDLPAMRSQDLPALLSFLDIDINTFSKAISALPAEERGYAVMVLGDQGKSRFLPAMLSAVRGVWGDFQARAALKRLARFGDSPEIRETLERVAFGPKAEDLQPYLRMAMVQVDQEWAFEVMHDAAQANEDGLGNAAPPGMTGGKPWWKFWNR